jgi:L-aspartate oxidase
MPQRFDFLVLGGGVAGLSFALQAAQRGSVAVLTKRSRSESNTMYAQGGVAAVLSERDSFDQHVADTVDAGAGLNNPEAVSVTVREGPERIRELAALGAHFDTRPDGEFDLGREGGHTWRRIVHAGDITGREIERALLAACDDRPNIRSFSDSAAIDVILDRRSPHGQPRCLGAYVLLSTGEIETFLAKVVVVATGGAGKVYLYTTNPDVATGDGVAMAYRAGADRQHGVLPIPPHLPLQPRGEELPHLRGAARRGREAAAAQRRTVHAALRPPRRARPARHRGPGHRLGAEAHR